MNYPGGKNGSGVYQTIINQLPPHSLYVEVFLGSGAVLHMKRPAACSIAIDADPIAATTFSGDGIPYLTVICADALTWLQDHIDLPSDALVYLDPPYLMTARSSPRQIYRHEFATFEQHSALLDVITRLRCMVIISGYHSTLYANRLSEWRTVQFTTQTRGGTTATEWLWMNYPQPLQLHDYRYLGSNFRERERIQRKKKRWTAEFLRMPALERQALASAIAEIDGGAGGIAGPDYAAGATCTKNDAISPNLVQSLFPAMQDPSLIPNS